MEDLRALETLFNLMGMRLKAEHIDAGLQVLKKGMHFIEIVQKKDSDNGTSGIRGGQAQAQAQGGMNMGMGMGGNGGNGARGRSENLPNGFPGNQMPRSPDSKIGSSKEDRFTHLEDRQGGIKAFRPSQTQAQAQGSPSSGSHSHLCPHGSKWDKLLHTCTAGLCGFR